MTTSDLTQAFSTMEPDELVQAIEEIEEMVRHRNLETDRLKAEKLVAEMHLLRKLSPGEAVQAPSGRVVWKDEGPQGQATINRAAFDELEPDLPAGLRLTYVTKYPSVGDVRKAAKEHKLPKGITEDDLLIPAPTASKLRWRTISGVES